jgi:hypothetical protein
VPEAAGEARARAPRASRLRRGALAAALGALALGAAPARAAGPPLPGPAWAGEVAATSARLHATVDPNGLATRYRFDYIAKTAYEANLSEAREGFAGARSAPAGAEAPLGSGSAAIAVSQQLGGLDPETAYRYRLVAQNSAGAANSPASGSLGLIAQGLGGASPLADGRGWEMVSPVDKNGGALAAPGQIFGGALLQAAEDGDSVTYSSTASFGEGAQGAPPASQYVATRGAGGWSSANVSAPLLAGSYGEEPEGVPYRLFSTDLARAVMLDPRRCPEAGPCPRSYSLRAGTASLAETPAIPGLRLEGADPDLRHVVLGSPEGLYEWSEGPLEPLSAASGARLAAPAGAVSGDGERVYFTAEGSLHLREGAQTKQLDAALGGGGSFQLATADGSVAYFAKAGHLYRYLAAGAGQSADLTPAGGVAGVLGASTDGETLYYQDGAGLERWREGTTTTIAPGPQAAAPSDYPPATGTARVSADGSRLAFLSRAPLSGYDNTDQLSGEADTELFLYEAGAGGTLACLSCNPTEERPIGPSTIPGAIPNGAGPDATDAYKPRVLAAGGARVFFDSADALVLADTDNAPDAYEWEARGTGSCARPGGCLALVSSGKGGGGAFADASAGGADAFFLTAASLLGADPGSVDLYDAREGGGFPAAAEPIPCEGDACQALPAEPEDPAIDTLVAGPGNPPVRYRKAHHRKSRGHRRHRGRRAVHRGGRR